MNLSREKFEDVHTTITELADDSEFMDIPGAKEELDKLIAQRDQALALAEAEAQIEDVSFEENRNIEVARSSFLRVGKKLDQLNINMSMFSSLRGVSEILVDPLDKDGSIQVGMIYPSTNEEGRMSPEMFICTISKEGVVSDIDSLPRELRNINEASILTEVIRYVNELVPDNAIVITGDVISSEQEMTDYKKEQGKDSPKRIPFNDRQFTYLRRYPGYLFEVKSNERGFAGTYRTFVFEKFAILESHIQGNATYIIRFDTPIKRAEFEDIIKNSSGDSIELNDALTSLLNTTGYKKYSRSELRDMGNRYPRNHPNVSKNGSLLDPTIIDKNNKFYCDGLMVYIKSPEELSSDDYSAPEL